MKQLFTSADKYLKASDWKDLTIIKFCLFAMGVLVGTHITDKGKKVATIVSLSVFIATYIPLMAKYFSIVLDEEDVDLQGKR